MIDFLLRSVDLESIEAMAIMQGFMDEDGQPMPGADFDPSPGSGAGIPIQPPEEVQGGWVPGRHTNLRISGELEQAQIEGIPQTEKGELLPLRERTLFGLFMDANGTEWVGENGKTTGISYAGVTFIDPESVDSPQRVWQ